MRFTFRPVAAVMAALTLVAVPSIASASSVTGPAPALLGGAPIAVTADHDPVRDPFPQGFNNAFGPDSVGALAVYMRVEDVAAVRVLCVENGIDFPTWNPFDPPADTPPTDYEGAGWLKLRQGDADALRSVAWLVSNMTYGPDGEPTGVTVGTPLTEGGGLTAGMLVAGEAAATQLAVWRILEGTDLTDVANSAIRNRALELTELARNATDLPAEAPHAYGVVLDVVPASADTVQLRATVTATTGDVVAGVEGVDVAVSFEDEVTYWPFGNGPAGDMVLVTGPDGTATSAPFAVPTEPVTATATATFTLAPGTLLTARGPDGEVMTTDDANLQQVVTVDPVDITRTASVLIRGAVVTPPTTPPTTEPPVTDTTPDPGPPAEETGPTGGRKELPYTGGLFSLPVLGIGAAAGGLGLWLRRRYSS